MVLMMVFVRKAEQEGMLTVHPFVADEHSVSFKLTEAGKDWAQERGLQTSDDFIERYAREHTFDPDVTAAIAGLPETRKRLLSDYRQEPFASAKLREALKVLEAGPQ